MGQKIIGVTPRYTTVEGTLKQADNDNYMIAMQNLGFTPIILPMGLQANDRILDVCDGFLVTGGTDILPKFFNQENNGSEEGNETMDLTDKVVVEYAVKSKKPMLGICRGHQAINVFMGGTLIQDIGKGHQSVRHNVKTIKNRLINFPEILNVNSFHHQVLDELAPGLINIATSEVEGYSEAFIHESLPIISFQWHPERMTTEDSGKLIFKTFQDLINKN